MGIEALREAVEWAGGQTPLARAIAAVQPPGRTKVKQQHVWHWLNVSRSVPADHVLAIEQATGGHVTRHELRPDLYPLETDVVAGG